ncbi:MAG: DUF4115 domain-containing protein, partial [Clostridia bacterium]|nr:DUF4115 domain-containing protein [Clostridia bacterium]
YRVSSGQLLKETREALGLTLKAAEEETKIRKRYIDALEQEDYAVLPGRVYAKAFLRTYAKYLGLKSEALVQEFDQRYPMNGVAAEPERAPVITPVNRTRPRYFGVLVAVSVVMALFAFNALYGSGVPHMDRVQDPPVVGETPVGNQDSDTQAPVNEPLTPSEGRQDVQILLVVKERPSWVRVLVDGNVSFEGTVPAGRSLDFTGKESVTFRLGNAGDVEVHLNGENLGALGRRGEIVEREFVVRG